MPDDRDLNELRDVKAMLGEEAASLGPRRWRPALVEVPATAIMAAQFAREELFSIGRTISRSYPRDGSRTSELAWSGWSQPGGARSSRIPSGAPSRWADGSACRRIASDPGAAPILLGIGVTN
jgi:phosphoenolpyruvate-protein kinase (PTS system EI component)